MSKTITNRNLKTEISFIPDEAKVFCRDLGYGYQLVFKYKNWEGDKESRIFVAKYEEERVEVNCTCPYCEREIPPECIEIKVKEDSNENQRRE